MQDSQSPSGSGHRFSNKPPIWWAKRIGIAAGVLIVLLILFVPLIVHAVIRHELNSAIAGNMNAQLEIDDLSWHPLLGVSIGHARLITNDSDGKPVVVAELNGLTTSLAHIPFGGPIVVENFVLLDPSIDLIKLPSGEITLEQNLFKSQPPSSASSSSSGKMSDTIQVKHFQIKDLTIRVIDETNPSAPPRTWAAINIEGTQGSSPGDYDIQAAVVETALAELKINTSIDTDSPEVKFNHFSLTINAPTDQSLTQLPPEIANYIRTKNLQGAALTLSIADNAALMIDTAKNHWSLTGFDGQLQLSSPPGSQTGKPMADGKISFSAHGGGPLPSDSMSGLTFLGALDPDSSLSVHTDSNLSLQTTVLPQPITDCAFDLECSNTTLTLKTFDVHYGSQPIHMDLAASLLAKQLKLAGFHLNAAQGTVLVDSAQMDLTAPYHYAANVNFSGIQISDLKVIAQINDPGGKLAGVAAGKLNASGTFPPAASPLSAIQGDGTLQVENGDFWDIPVLGEIAGKINPNFAQAGRVGSAAAVYTLGNGQITFSQLAVSSPIVGIQGHGNVGLLGENPLDLILVAAPLGDWQKQINKTNIPGIGLFGQAMGGAQKAINNVSEQALLSFHVTGPAASPSINPVAAPALTGAAKDIFGNMVKGGQGAGSLLNFMQPQQKN